MKTYKRLTFFQNKSRQKSLIFFTKDLNNYFSVVSFDNYSLEIINDKRSLQIRQKINRDIPKIKTFLRQANIQPIATWIPPPTLGGHTQRIDILDNVFNLYKHDVDEQVLIDFIDQAIGIYQSDFISSVIRTFNPLFWAKETLDYLISFPLSLLAHAGLVNRNKVEESTIWKIIKLVSQIIVVGFGSV